MTLQIHYTEEAQKALELCDDIQNPDFDKIYGELGPDTPVMPIHEKNDKKNMNLADFRLSIRDHAQVALHEFVDSIDAVEISDYGKQFTQDDLYAIDKALEYSKVKAFNEKGRADRLREKLDDLENKGRLHHLKRAVFG